MKVLVVHNQYQQTGGEYVVVRAETALLQRRGHEVVEYRRHNEVIEDYSLLQKAALYFSTTWSKKSYREVRELCRTFKPDVAHFHNILPLISPSAYYACKDEGVPVVQAVQNYRLVCPGALLMREGKVCEECLNGDLRPALKHRCYRGSYLQTRAVVRMLRRHRRRGTYEHVVDRYLAATEFARQKLIESGLPAGKIAVKPNFVLDAPEPRFEGEYAVYVGRLSSEKGIHMLLEAWRQGGAATSKRVPAGPAGLVVVGSGALAQELRSKAPANVRFAGEVPHEKAMEIVLGAKFLVLPSLCYEGFPLALAEAFACGKPVVASRLGSLEEIVEDGKTGFFFEPGDTAGLAAAVGKLIESPVLCSEMGQRARAVYEEKYSSEVNYRQLVETYGGVATSKRVPAGPPSGLSQEQK